MQIKGDKQLITVAEVDADDAVNEVFRFNRTSSDSEQDWPRQRHKSKRGSQQKATFGNARRDFGAPQQIVNWVKDYSRPMPAALGGH
jgi:hypothetical protein